MNKLTGSTKRSDWEQRWVRELPREWGKGRIELKEGSKMLDLRDILLAAFITIIIALTVYGFLS